jgi:hypothetical protein
VPDAILDCEFFAEFSDPGMAKYGSDNQANEEEAN